MDITANLVTPSQLSNWMQEAVGRSTANQDEWCYALNQITGAVCPNYDIGNPPSVQTSAETFLEGLRNFQLGYNYSNQGAGSGPGGANSPAAAIPNSPAATVSKAGIGLFGPTDCRFCIWLKNNPWVLLLAIVAIYFGFFYKK